MTRLLKSCLLPCKMQVRSVFVCAFLIEWFSLVVLFVFVKSICLIGGSFAFVYRFLLVSFIMHADRY